MRGLHVSTRGEDSTELDDPRLQLYRSLIRTIDVTILADAVPVLEVEPDRSSLKFAATTARARNLLRGVTVRWGNGLVGQCAQHRRSLICNDVSQSTGFLDLADRLFRFQTRSVMCCPIAKDDALLGVFEVVNRLDADGFGGPQLEQFAILTRRMSHCWSEGSATSRALFDAAVLQCRQFMDVAGLSLLSADPKRTQLVFEQSLTDIATGLEGCRLARGQGLAGSAADSDEPVLVEDVHQDERFFRGVDAVSSFTSSSLIAVPFHNDGRVVGVLELINSHLSEPFTASELATAQQLALNLERDLALLEVP